MKTCTIYGDLSSDSAVENYPTVQICDECADLDAKLREDAQIVTSGTYDSSYGESCEYCEKTYQEELEEKP